jgi:GNAT superfamily N-acetyltransferase
MSSPSISHAASDVDVLESFPVMKELRPHLESDLAYLAQFKRLQVDGYRLLVARSQGQVTALAGYRISENTIDGRFLYVDDLVSTAASRGQGMGGLLLEALEEIAREAGCKSLTLDTGLKNQVAQKFYSNKGMVSVALHFRKALF